MQFLDLVLPLGLHSLAGRPAMILIARRWSRAADPTPAEVAVLGFVSQPEAAQAELFEAGVHY